MRSNVMDKTVDEVWAKFTVNLYEEEGEGDQYDGEDYGLEPESQQGGDSEVDEVKWAEGEEAYDVTFYNLRSAREEQAAGMCTDELRGVTVDELFFLLQKLRNEGRGHYQVLDFDSDGVVALEVDPENQEVAICGLEEDSAVEDTQEVNVDQDRAFSALLQLNAVSPRVDEE
jgi:hypothetical protein